MVMEDGRTRNKGGPASSVGSLVGAAAPTMGMRGKTSQLPLLEALVDQRLGAIPTGVAGVDGRAVAGWPPRGHA